MMFRVLAIVGLAGLGACTGNLPAGADPAQLATPAVLPSASTDAETPNSLPIGSATLDPETAGDGVVGVRHLPPF